MIISTIDSSPGVAGKGLEILKKAGVKVEINVLNKIGKALFRPRQIFVEKLRPYIILKYAQTVNSLFCEADSGRQTWITNNLSARIVHKWRNEADSILVGTNTALVDNPKLTNRLYYGKSPLRIVLDKNLKIPIDYHLLDGTVRTIVVTDQRCSPPTLPNVDYLRLDFSENILPKLLSYLHEQKIGSLIVGGGIKLLEHFLEQDLWDEARVLEGSGFIANGRPSPAIPLPPARTISIDSDRLYLYYNDC